MHENEVVSYKNYIVIIYAVACSVFSSNAIIFEQGLFVGFLTGMLSFIPNVWTLAICFLTALLKIQTGEFVPYLILLTSISILACLRQFIFKSNPIFKVITYFISYVPCFLIFKITPYYQLANYIISIITACISEQIACKFNGMKDFSFLFTNYFPNCFLLFIIGISSPLIIFWKFNMYHIAFSFCTLLYSKLADEKTCIWSMLFLAFGGYIVGNEYSMLILTVCVFTTLSVSEWNGGISFLVYMLSLITTSVFIKDANFNIYSTILSAAVGGFCFLIVPHKKIKEVTAKNKYASQKEIINRDRSKISIKIEELANCFTQISSSYKELSSSQYKEVDSIKYITGQTSKCICESCDKKLFCRRSELQRNSELEYLAHCAMNKNKTTILDFGEFISNNCIQKVEIINKINKIAQEAKNQILQLEEKSKSKEEVARTYSRVAQVLKKLSSEASKKISFDISAQLEIASSLDKSNIFYKELFIYQNENKCVCVELFASKEDTIEILNCIEEVFGHSFYVENCMYNEDKNTDFIIFCISPRLSVEYGYSTRSKKQGAPNGDSMTIMSLENGRFVTAICDGMGSGENAHQFSQKAVSFLENLFKAGFVASDIITSVNSFMESCEYNSYATLDILEIDLYAEKAYLYKVGSPDTYWHSERTHQISSKALPIGIMKEIKLEINSLQIHGGDIIVLSSDGILDLARREIEYGIRQKNFPNPQIFSDKIMQECEKKMKQSGVDDRTIITLQIIKNE